MKASNINTRSIGSSKRQVVALGFSSVAALVLSGSGVFDASDGVPSFIDKVLRGYGIMSLAFAAILLYLIKRKAVMDTE